MLRHFKMEFKRQQLAEQMMSQENTTPNKSPLAGPQQQQQLQQQQQPNGWTTTLTAAATTTTTEPAAAPTCDNSNHIKAAKSRRPAAPAKRTRGRRSSKPAMEKRRRARINECLDILKSYVLTDSSNLSHLGVKLAGDELRDEESVAREVLKSSGLINRHRGRKNPNKLEKADILELTVDYVHRLHKQRDQLMALRARQGLANLLPQRPLANRPDLDQPLTLDLSPRSRLDHRPPPTPPPSSASSSPNSNNNQVNNSPALPKLMLARVLNGYGLHEWAPY